MSLSKHFKITEFLKEKDKERCQKLVPDFEKRLREKIVIPILEALRKAIALPIHITSGYRTEEENALIGGKPHSHHLCEADRIACDFTCEDMSAAWRWLELHRDRFCYAYWNKQRNIIHISGLTFTDHRIGIMWII